MPGVARYRIVWTLAAALFLGFLSLPAAAQIRFDLPSQSLAQALTSVGNLANLNVYFDPSVVDGHQAPALKADVSVDEALSRLLAGTSLKAVRVDENTVRVVADPSEKHAQSTHASDTGAAYTPNNGVRLAFAGGSQDVNAQGSTRVAAAGAGTPAELSATENDAGRSRGLEQVVVSAQKRDERLQDVPVPVTAVSAQTLTESNQVRLQDYYTQIPGLTVTPSEFNGSATISIRGITSGDFTNPTVGITVDDMPYGSSTALGGGYLVPDLDPSDLARIEVLRGPQGTLYGASSIGGLLKYVTVDPSTESISGRLQAGLSGVHNGPHAGYSVSGAVNLPVNDTIAVRASGFFRRDPGYIDNVQDGQRGANEAEVYGGHLSALWKPSDALSLKLSAMLQDSHFFGSPSVTIEPGLGDLQQDFLPGTGRVDRKFQAYSATVKAKLGIFDLTSVTGYSINNLNDIVDYTPAIGAYYTQPLFGVTGSPNTDVNSTDKFSQELRLTSFSGSRFDWLLGAFYTHERSPFLEQFLAADSTGQIVGTTAAFNWFVTYAEIAGFADLTWHVTDQFDVQFGGRESQIRQSYAETDSGPYVAAFENPGGPTPLEFPEVVVRSNAFTYVVTPQYKFSPDLMLYARLASGFRPGGPNPTASVFGLPVSFRPDKTQSYEIGIKGNVLDHKLSFDGSVYYIDWKDIQLSLVDQANGLSFYSNGGRAKSHGIELSVEARPIRGLKIDASATWNDAVLKEAFPANSLAYGNAGDRLPYSSRYSGNLSVDEDIPLGTVGLIFVGGSLSYVGDRIGAFTGTADRQDMPSYTKLDLRGGFTHDTWTATLYINNVSDKRGVLGGGVGTLIPTSFQYIQPRTIGLSVAKTF